MLLIGTMRYAFVAAARVLPWLNGSLPPSTARKTVAALQGIVLLVVGAGILPVLPAFAAVFVALALLMWSFGRDIRWLWRVRDGEAAKDVSRSPDLSPASNRPQELQTPANSMNATHAA